MKVALRQQNKVFKLMYQNKNTEPSAEKVEKTQNSLKFGHLYSF